MPKYEPSYNKQELENDSVLERANNQADFYLSKISEIKETNDRINLIHFFNDKKVISDSFLKNKSSLYDCDREWLKKIGLNLDLLDRNFNPNLNYLVAIPIDKLQNWVKTKSWLKLSQAGVLDNAVIFSIPKGDIIYREHNFIDKSFNNKDDLKLVKDYYNSTSKESNDFKMPEVWIPEEVFFSNDQILSFNV